MKCLLFSHLIFLHVIRWSRLNAHQLLMMNVVICVTCLLTSVLQTSPSQMSSSSSSSSLPSLDVSMSSSNTNTSAANSTASRTLTVPGQSPVSKPQHDFYIIRVTYETSSVETDGEYLPAVVMSVLCKRRNKIRTVERSQTFSLNHDMGRRHNENLIICCFQNYCN